MVRDLKIGSLKPIGRFTFRSDVGLNTAAIKSVAQSYDANMLRVVSLLRMPANIVRWTSVFDNCFHRSMMEVYGIVEPGLDRSMMTKEDQRNRVFEGLLSEWNARDNATEEWQYYVPNLHSLCLQARDPIFTRLEAMLESLVIQSWTAFEEMSERLWIALLNEHPQDLSRLDGDWELPKGPKDPEPSKKNKAAPAIGLDWIASHDFNVSKVMGAILASDQNFQSLFSIRDAFARALGKHCANLKAALLDDAMMHLSAIRNCLVHSAGIADDQFERQIVGSPHFAPVSVGTRIKLNGEIVESIVSRVIANVQAMFVSADRFLSTSISQKNEK